MAKKVSASDKRHADFMINTLGPDLKASGAGYTATDVMRCGRLMKAGKRNRKFGTWLKSTLIPDLRESGHTYTANDLARCARAISGTSKRGRQYKKRSR